jgi:hypothetical protein
MLNTLYPPVMMTQPTAKLTIPILTKQRDGFFKYIQTVERRGNKDCLDNLISQNKLEGEATGQDSYHSKNASTSSNKSTFSQFSQFSQQSSRPGTPIGKGGSTLERIAREFRKMRPKQKVEVNEIIPQRSYHDLEQENGHEPAPAKTTMSRLRKMKSLGALSDLKQSNSSQSSLRGVGGSGMPMFDPEEMKRQRDAFERRAAGA